MSPDQFTRVHGYARFYGGLHRVSGLLPPLARLGVGRIAGYGARDARSFRATLATPTLPLVDAAGALSDPAGSLLTVSCSTTFAGGSDAVLVRLAAQATTP